MTNAEKYLKDGVDTEEFIKELQCFWWLNEYDICEGIRKFLSAEAKKKKPTLTEDERVILKNLIGCEWKIGREKSGELYLITVAHTKRYFGMYLHLFQFIKERRRILNRRTFERRIKMIKKEVRELCKMEHHNGYKGTLYSDGTMDIYYKGKPIYLHGSNKVSSPDELYRTLELMPSIMREIREQNEKDFGR